MSKKAKVTVKPVVTAKHNINLEGLSLKQLAQLSVDTNVLMEKTRKAEAANKLKELKENDKFEELKVQYKELVNQAKEISKEKLTTTLNIPLTLSYSTAFNYDNWDEAEYDDEFFEEKCTGGLGKEHNLNKKQLGILKPAVEDYIQDACDVIYDLIEGSDQSKNLVDKIASFRNKLKDLGLTFKDLK